MISDKHKLIALTLSVGGALLYIYILGTKTFYVVGFLVACYVVTKLLSMLQNNHNDN